jgi:hypothetical protein
MDLLDRATAREAGHSVAWEQPDAFNQAVLTFLRASIRRIRPGICLSCVVLSENQIPDVLVV